MKLRILLAGLIYGLVALAAENGLELLQKAVTLEKVDGNLEEAIKLYQRVAKEFSSDRALAAKALMQEAHCYELLGPGEQDKAVRIYEQVTRDFGDQRQPVETAQGKLASLRFEVASVKRAAPVSSDSGGITPPTVTGGLGTSSPTQIRYHLMPLGYFVSTSFGIRPDQITGPNWLAMERYDIVANIPPGTTPAQFNVMLRNLLRERFNLQFHFDSKNRSIYVLRVGKNGAKLKEWVAAPGAAEPSVKPGGIGQPDENGYPILPPNYKGILGRGASGQTLLAGQGASLAELIRWLESPAERPIIDETGRSGRYDFKLHFGGSNRGGAAGASDDPVPSVFAALEEQLGLKLEGRSIASDILVIDSVDREPTPN